MKFCLVVPVFNHAATVRSVLDDLRASVGAQQQIVVVDDGSTDASAAACENLPGVTLLRHPKNRGKGAALLTAFRWAHQRGFSHAITVDSDGQHCPADVPRIIDAARAHPDDVIVGWRDMDAACARGMHVPARSRKGRDAARFWLRVQTGQDIPDTQCGLRAYPLAPTLALRYWFKRYDFETEVLARLAWAGLRVRSVPVECIYFPADRRVSHFRPIVDTLRGVRVNIALVVRRLMPWPIQRLAGRDEHAHRFGKWWKLASWRDAARRALREGSSNAELATAFAMGVFVGLTPFYFLQTLLAIFFARRLHLNVLAAVIGSQVSCPPLAPLWLILSYGIGNLLLNGRWALAHVNGSPFAWIWAARWPFLLGNLCVASVTATLSLLLARAVLSMARPNSRDSPGNSL